MNTTELSSNLEWWMDYYKKSMAESILKAQRLATDFATLVASKDDATVFEWNLDSLAQDLQKINEEVKTYKAKIEALEIAAGTAKKLN